MVPKRTREALEHSFLGVFNEDLKVLDGVDPVAMDLIEEAAQWAVDLFEECENCEGSGFYFEHIRPDDGPSEPCPSCDGRGYVLNEERLEAAVGAHAEAEGFISPLDDAFVSMRAAISAFLFGDSTETRQEET